MAGERLGYLRQAEQALRNSDNPQDTHMADAVSSLLKLRGGDIFVSYPYSDALKALESSEDLRTNLNNALCSFNIPSKNAIILRLNSQPISEAALAAWYEEIFKDTQIEARLPQQTVRQFCDTLIRFGMVEQVGEEYSLTQQAKETGQPIAAKILNFETAEDYSIYPIFGHIQNPSKDGQSAPLTRAQILLELAKGNDRNGSLSQVLQKPPFFLVHTLTQLKKAGIVDFDPQSLAKAQRVTKYKRAEGASIGANESNPQGRQFFYAVVDSCDKLHAEGKEIYQEAIAKILPQDILNAQKSQKHLAININKALRKLKNGHGYLKVDTARKGAEIIKTASLTAKGKKLVDDLLLPVIHALQRKPVLNDWQENLIPRVKSNLNRYAKNSAEFYYPFSHGTKRNSREMYKQDILEYVVQLANTRYDDDGNSEMRAEDIAELMGVNTYSVYSLLNELTRQRKLKTEDRKGVFHYFPADA